MEESASVIIKISDIMAMLPFETGKLSGMPPITKTKIRAVSIISELLLRKPIATRENRLGRLLGVIESNPCSALLFFLEPLREIVLLIC